MEKGFKARCEQMARTLRAGFSISADAPLPVSRLAQFLRVAVWSISELELSPEDTRQLVTVDPDAWSAVTVSSGGREAIIVNPQHRGGRFSSDVMHELAHLLLGHEPSTVFFVGESRLALRAYVGPSEEEANWLAAALLLPRDALVHIARNHMQQAKACAQYGVSRQLLTYRLNVTGVNRQFRRTRVRSG